MTEKRKTEAAPEASEEKPEEKPKPMTKEEKRRAFLVSTLGAVKGNAVADEEEKQKKILYP